MRWPKALQWVSPLIPIVASFLAPYIDAKLKGTPLNGVPGILSFWKSVLHHPIPAWLAALAIFLTFTFLTAFQRWRRRLAGKSDLGIVVLSAPPARWSKSGKANLPYMSVSFNARFAVRGEQSLEIVKGYLKGTECITPFPPIVVAWPSGCSAVVRVGVRPLLAREGRSVRRRVVLVDQFGDEHLTEPITFEWAKPLVPDWKANPINCFVCGKPIALEELSELMATPAHKRCVE